MRAADNLDYAVLQPLSITLPVFDVCQPCHHEKFCATVRIGWPGRRQMLTGQEELLKTVGAREHAAEPTETPASKAELLTMLKELPALGTRSC